MAKSAAIPITDHNDGDTCSLSYTVRYKLSSLSNWTELTQQQPVATGSPLVYYLTIQPLEDDVSYDYEILRNCCDGLVSVAAAGTFTSTDT